MVQWNTISMLMLGATLALIASAAEPPVIEPPETPPRTFTLSSTDLTVTPGEETVYLRFAGNVKLRSEGEADATFTISADVVELDVEADEALGDLEITFPEVPDDDGRIVSNPGQVISEMAREMELPRTRFSSNNLRRLGAAGNVEVSTALGVLRTESLISTDGGQTWAAEGRSVFHHIITVPAGQSPLAIGGLGSPKDTADDDKPPEMQTLIIEFAANYLLYDAAGGHALARGNIIGDVSIAGAEDAAPLLHLEAERCEVDITAQTLSASEGLKLRAGDMGMCCGELHADLKQGRVLATDGPHLENRAAGITIDADLIEAAIDGSELIAHGDVLLMAHVQDIRLHAVEVVITRQGEGYRARCRDTEATIGNSELSGEYVTVQIAGEKIIVEIEGDQHYKLDVSELENSENNG